MGIQDAIAVPVAAAALFYVARGLWRTMNAKGCGSGCGCGMSREASDAAQPDERRLKRTPLVTLETPGRPAPRKTQDP
ncbi:MAG: hypothetical protein AABZ12_11110 [Planctomycetota bacterium]